MPPRNEKPFAAVPEHLEPKQSQAFCPCGYSWQPRSKLVARCPLCGQKQGLEVKAKVVAMEVVNAVEADLPKITEIYNDVIRTSTAIFNDAPVSVEDRIAWWKARVAQGYPVIVARDEKVIAGFATFGDFRPWPGYRFTVEGTIHIDSSARRKGVGAALLQALIARARAAGKHVMVAGVDSANVASLQFLEGNGFERVGHLREVGYKFDRFLDLVFLQYTLEPLRS
jgi:L-amino acid N-acyltransferase YncA